MENKENQPKEDTPPAMKMSLQMKSHKPSLMGSPDMNMMERQRSKTENVFMYRPEFVPRPRPKVTDILPTPMLLCKQPTNDPSNEVILSRNNSNGEETKWIKDVDQLNINDEVSSLFSDIRKELAEISVSNSYKNYSKDYEPGLNIGNKLNEKKDFRFSTKKSQRKSIWKKYIEIEDMNYHQNPKLRYSMKNAHYSILRILEGAANDSMKKKIQVI